MGIGGLLYIHGCSDCKQTKGFIMKYHVQRGTSKETGLPMPACAVKGVYGSPTKNSRHYGGLSAEYVKSPKEFRNVPQEDRCAHCMDQYLIFRNQQRKAKGLPPVSSPFEGLED